MYKILALLDINFIDLFINDCYKLFLVLSVFGLLGVNLILI